MVFQSLICRISALLLLLALALPGIAQEGNAAAGKDLFRSNCAACHNKNMKDKMTGPALGGARERWGDDEALHAWIRNSQALVSAGNPRAAQLFKEWNGVVMQPFPNLTDEQINNILAYIDGVVAGTIDGPPPPPTGSDATATNTTSGKPNNTPLFIVLALILGVLAVVLARIVANLNYMVQLREGQATAHRRTLVEILTSRGVIAFVIFALVILGGYTTVNNAIALGRQQGYEPTQPIKFSHAIHAGQQKIDCQYCHDGARRSKHSNIPAANTCMNCHRAIKVGSLDGTAELTKIYASIGFDPSTDKYIENYDQMSREDIERIYKKWIADNYVEQKGTIDRIGEKTIEDQWDGIVKALTNKETGDDQIAGPIEWTRIHNLPDHVYFNHSQHVAVGQLACQTCHGKVEEMTVVAQFAPLSMGWCINCHRQTEIKFEGGYYDNYYEKYHREVANGTKAKVTVEDIGGLECQKCHY